MGTLKSIILVYLCYLILDGVLRFWKIFTIMAEYGFFLTIRIMIDLLISYLRKPFGGDESKWRIIDFYTIKLKIDSFTDILLFPTKLIDQVLKKLSIYCAFHKGTNSGISHEAMHLGLTTSQTRTGLEDSSMPGWANKVPIFGQILGSAFFIIEYHIMLILELFPMNFNVIDHTTGKLITAKKLNRDLFGCSSLPKIIRLLSLEVITIFLVLTWGNY